MWITQTYLGTVEPDAKLFVYYFFENYIQEQQDFTERVQRELEKIGEAFGDQVSLLMPNPRYAERIEAEVRENRELWYSIHGNLPGLFLTRKPLIKLGTTDDGCVYIPFDTFNPELAAEVIQYIRGIISNTVARVDAQNATSKWRSFGELFLEAVEVKPGIFGFNIDLKKLIKR